MKSFLLFILALGLIVWVVNTWLPQTTMRTIGNNSLEQPTNAQIRAQIDRLNGKPVIVNGLVISSFFACGFGGYVLDDGTATLRILTDNQPPLQGKVVSAIVEPKLVAALNSRSLLVASQVRLLTSEVPEPSIDY